MHHLTIRIIFSRVGRNVIKRNVFIKVANQIKEFRNSYKVTLMGKNHMMNFILSNSTSLGHIAQEMQRISFFFFVGQNASSCRFSEGR